MESKDIESLKVSLRRAFCQLCCASHTLMVSTSDKFVIRKIPFYLKNNNFN